MKRLTKVITLLMVIFLSGCVNFMSMRNNAARQISVEDVENIKPGMAEKELISILGSPDAFGKDDEGREYLHYEKITFNRLEKSAVAPFIGAIATESAIVGFAVNFYVADGIVQGKSKYFFRAADNEKAKDNNQSSSN